MNNSSKFKIIVGGILVAVTILGIGYGTTLDVNSNNAFFMSIFIFLILIISIAAFSWRTDFNLVFEDDEEES